MSTCKRQSDPAEGFTLVEVMVALGLTMLVLVATLPALISMLKSSIVTKQDTKAKNLSQERIEQMRDLRYHIDRQNGPFLDLLDIYYTNAKSATPTTTLSVGGASLSGQYVASGAAANGEPVAPFYRTTIANVGGVAGFSQVVDLQFLSPAGAVLPASRFLDTYDSQTVGQDQAPSLLVGVTVITKWTAAGKAKSLRTNTRIAEERSALPVIQTQARAVAVEVTSTGADGATLLLQEGIATADGAQSSGSTAAGLATGALASRTGDATVLGVHGELNLPVVTGTTSGSSSPQAGSGCGWYGFGRTGITDVTADISSGLPKAPSDVDAATPANKLSGYVSDNSGGGCGLLSFSNLVGGGSAVSTASGTGFEMGSAPYVKVADVMSGSAAAVSGSAFVSSNALTSIPQKSTSGSAALLARTLTLFPNNPESGGRGLLSVSLASGSTSCGSGTTTTDGTVVGIYSLSLGWWGRNTAAGESVASWHTATWTYNSGTATFPVLQSGSAVWAPTTTLLGNGLRLSDLVTTNLVSTGPAVVNVGGQTGLRGFTDGIFSMTSASTLANESVAGYSAIKVRIGQLTCVADDER